MDASKRLLSGIGCVLSVGTESLQARGDNSPLGDDAREASRGLSNLLLTDATKRAAFAIACAVLNTRFARCGYLYTVNDKCEVQWQSIDAGPARDVIAAELER